MSDWVEGCLFSKLSPLSIPLITLTFLAVDFAAELFVVLLADFPPLTAAETAALELILNCRLPFRLYRFELKISSIDNRVLPVCWLLPLVLFDTLPLTLPLVLTITPFRVLCRLATTLLIAVVVLTVLCAEADLVEVVEFSEGFRWRMVAWRDGDDVDVDDACVDLFDAVANDDFGADSSADGSVGGCSCWGRLPPSVVASA